MNFLKKIYNRFPNRIKKIIRLILGKDSKKKSLSLHQFEKKLLKYEVISFDIFDTLITRTIYDPDDLFNLMEQKITNVKLHDKFYNMRKKAENEARNKLGKDVNIDEIYDELGHIYGYNDKIINRLKKIEIDLELELICPRKDMINVLERLVKLNKTVILTSDMYLTKNIIIKMLKKCGYNEKTHFQKLYLSNEQNLRKDNGSMFEYLKKVYSGMKFVHIGDNILSDYNIPVKYGLAAINIPSSRAQFMRENYFLGINKYIETRTISDSLFLGYIINEQIFNSPFSCGIDSLEKISKTFLAPMIFELIKFIDKKSDSNDKLLFLAREGYYLEKIYEEYCSKFSLKPKKHYYFLASRKATMSATIENTNDIKNSINRDYKGTIKTFFKSVYDLDYNGDDFEIILPNDLEKVYEIIKKYKNDIIGKSNQYKEAYMEYINSIIDVQNDNIVIVDLGYSGTIQYHLSKMLNKSLKGIYLTNSNSVKKYDKTSKLLFAYDINENIMYEKIYHYSLILEYFLSAPYGQLQFFSKEKNKIVPVYNDETNDSKKNENIQKMFQYINQYIERMKELNDLYPVDITKELLCSNYISIVESNIITRSVKDEFEFMDSFSSDKTKNVFKIISRY